MKRSALLLASALSLICALHAQDLVSGGVNSWLFHTPDDGRTSLYFLPGTNGGNWGATAMAIHNNGMVGIGTASPSTQLDVAGSAHVSGNFLLGGGSGGSKLLLTNVSDTHFIRANGWWTEFVSHPNEGWKFLANGDGVMSREVVVISAGSGNVGMYLKKAAIINEGNYPYDTASLAVGDMQYGLNSAGGTLRLLNTINDGGGFTFRTQTGGVFSDKVIIANDGRMGIGTTNLSHKLTVNGTIRAKEVIVDTGWADYVFAEDYRLAPLSEVEAHIKAHKHLPDMPSAAEVAEKGVSMGEMQARMMAKIEELTLHVIEQQKQLNAATDLIAKQADRIDQLESVVTRGSPANQP